MSNAIYMPELRVLASSMAREVVATHQWSYVEWKGTS